MDRNQKINDRHKSSTKKKKKQEEKTKKEKKRKTKTTQLSTYTNNCGHKNGVNNIACVGLK